MWSPSNLLVDTGLFCVKIWAVAEDKLKPSNLRIRREPSGTELKTMNIRTDPESNSNFQCLQGTWTEPLIW